MTRPLDQGPIAVLGGGNGGQCMAADLALRGYDVSLYEVPEFSDRLAPVASTRRIELTGWNGPATAQLREVTFDMKAVLAEADLVCLVTPAFAHRRFFDEMIAYLRHGQTVVMWAGDFGSLALQRQIRERRGDIAVTIVETNTLPYGARLRDQGKVDLLLTAPKVIAAALPLQEGEEAIALMQSLWPCVMAAQDVLSAAMSNPNPIVHPAGSLLNTGWIQQEGPDFHMYRVGITEAVSRVIEAVFSEVRSVAETYGAEVTAYEERDFRTTGSIMAVAFQAPFDTLGVIAGVAGPTSVHDRYITEDLPYGLLPISQLADLAGLPTPTIDALIDLGSAVCGEDFRATGRGLDELGLKGLDVTEVRSLVGLEETPLGARQGGRT